MTGTVIKICILVIGYIAIVKLIDYIINRINKKELHIKFSSSIIKALLGIIALSAIGMQFNTTAEISKIIMQSSGLLVAVAGFAAQRHIGGICPHNFLRDDTLQVGMSVHTVRLSACGFL